MWLQAFSYLESYETVQVLLVAIQDMLRALGGFSLILLIGCSAFGMARITLSHQSNFGQMVAGNLHKAIIGDSFGATDSTLGLLLTFAFDITIVLILMGVMESILVSLYEESQDNAKMIRCYTQARQLLMFGVFEEKSGFALQVTAEGDLDRAKSKRQQKLLHMLKRSFALFKPLHIWRRLRRVAPERYERVDKSSCSTI